MPTLTALDAITKALLGFWRYREHQRVENDLGSGYNVHRFAECPAGEACREVYAHNLFIADNNNLCSEGESWRL